MADLDKSISGLGNRKDVSTSRSERPSRSLRDDFKKHVDKRRERSSKQDKEEEAPVVAENKSSIFDIASKKAQEQAAQSQIVPLERVENLREKGEIDLTPSSFSSSKVVQEEVVFPTSAHREPTLYSSAVATVVEAPQQESSAQTLQTLVDQIVDKLYTIKMGDVTDTVMTVKNPPILAGSELIVTSYSTARGEFNIAFTNLTQEAKQLLDSQQANLLAALEKQGYTAHIIVTTTEAYTKLPIETNSSTEQQPQKREESNERHQQKKQE